MLQMLLVSKSGSEKMGLQSPVKKRQIARSEKIGGWFIPYAWHRHAKSVADIRSLSPWHLEQRSLWGAQWHWRAGELAGDELMKICWLGCWM